MFFELFAFLLIISLIVIGLGYYSDIDVLKIVGFGFIFVLATILGGMGSDGIKYHDGDNITTTGGVTTITPNYSYFVNHTFGFFMGVMSALGFASVYLQRKNGRYNEE